MENPNTPAPAPDSKLHFLDYWRIIRIRKTVIFAVFLLVVLTTTIVTYWLPKYYASTVRIAVEKDAPDIPGLFEFRPTQSTYDPYFIQTEFEKIKSKSVLHNVIAKEDLNKRWASRYGVSLLETPETYQILSRRIDVRQFRNTSLIEIRVLSEDKDEATRLANDIAKEYKDYRLKVRKDAATAGIKIFTTELDEQKKKVKRLTDDLAAMRETNGISDAVADSQSVSTLEPETVRKLEYSRIEALNQYSAVFAMMESLSNLPPSDLRQALPSANQDKLLEDLLSRYAATEQELVAIQKQNVGVEHPDYQRLTALLAKIDTQINDRVKGLMIGLQTRVLSLKATLDACRTQLDYAKAQDVEMNKKYGPYILAKRNLESQKQIEQTMNLRVVQESVDIKIPKTAIVEVVDAAEPGLKPVRPNIPVNIALGVVVGLVVGVGLAFFIEYLDTSVKTIDDVERALGAPVLGVIPQNVGYLIEEGPESPHAEAYRVLRTNLLFSRKEDRKNTITIVSGGAGEGKSTTVFNLATVFAQNGQRVLVVDSDLRRPSLHKFLKVSNAIGLTNYLLKQSTLEEVIQTTNLPSLDFLPSGKLPSSSLGILNSTRMKEFISDVRQRYDMVFFDSPPIMGVSDASVLASEVDMTLLVVQYRKYPQIMTLRAKQMVDKVGGNLMGVVLNNINISQDSYYYYYSGYYYDYYSKRDEEDSSKPGGSKPKPPGDQAKLEIKQKY
jgi:succinoglycan biosynthesis transport protein ExoP